MAKYIMVEWVYDELSCRWVMLVENSTHPLDYYSQGRMFDTAWLPSLSLEGYLVIIYPQGEKVPSTDV